MITGITIREFRPGDQPAFQRLNEEWIRRHFVLESKDIEVLSDPEGIVLNRGGRIFFAIRDNDAVGCCALIPIGPAEYEVAKMGVTESEQRSGIGRLLLTQTIEAARASGARRLYLETNRKLTPAIRLYESLGFRHIPPERVPDSPYARADVYMEMIFDGAANAESRRLSIRSG